MRSFATGDIHEVVGVVRKPCLRSDRIKKLSTGEKYLGNAKQILESELVFAGGFSRREADSLAESNI